MSNPTMSKRQTSFLAPTENAKKLFQVIYREESKKEVSDDEVAKIKVSELISKMSFYYEKIRNTVDYEEEHLLRKNAIERILKRQIVIEGTITFRDLKSEEIAKHLLIELIRAGYLPNNKIPETKIDEIKIIIDKYLLLKELSLEEEKIALQEKNDLINWIIAIAASEIEERLGRSKIDMTVVDYMRQILVERIDLPKNSEFEADKEIQVFIGVHRNFLKFDEIMLGFILFKHYHPNWIHANENEIREVAKNIFALRAKIQEQIFHPLAGQLNRIISRYTMFFSVLVDVIKEDPIGVYDSFKKDPKAFPRKVKAVCAKRYKAADKRKWRASLRSIIYIFITKSVFALALEVPATEWFGQTVNTFSLSMNIFFPPFLLFFIVMMTWTPGEENSQKIVQGIEEIIFPSDDKKEPYRLRKPVKRSKMLNAIFHLIYTVTFFLTFGAAIWILDQVGFNWISIIIFLFFLALISFLSIRIRKGIKDLFILEPKESLVSFILDFFYVPIVQVGKWLSEKFSKINVFVFILDFIIEAPFKVFVEIAEEWTKYVRERKDEIS